MMNANSSMMETPTTPAQGLEINASRQFTPWLLEQNLSLAFTTYQAGKLFFIGLQPDGRLSVFERTFERCMGLYAQGSSLYMSSLYQLWRFENTLQPDRKSRPENAYTSRGCKPLYHQVSRRGQVSFER
jgi:uncharacterized protein (TIGR03032 family)